MCFHNVSLHQLSGRVEVYQGDALEVVCALWQDVVFFDPGTQSDGCFLSKRSVVDCIAVAMAHSRFVALRVKDRVVEEEVLQSNRWDVVINTRLTPKHQFLVVKPRIRGEAKLKEVLVRLVKQNQFRDLLHKRSGVFGE